MSLESKNKKVSNKKLLLLLSGTSRYSNGVISIPIAGQWLDYFNDQVEFYANLSLHITNNTVIRLYPHDYQWFQSERLLDKFPNVAIDYCDLSLESRLIKTKLFVGGWNSTAYLEAMGSNIPTIIFWDNRYFEIRKEVVEMFEALKKVQIFHDSPVSAAKHVESIWGNVDEWWYRDDVQKTKNDFVNCFANASKTIDDLEKIFKGIYECNLSV